MPLQLQIDDDEQIEELRDIYSSKANEITAAISKLQADLQKITPILIQLGLKTPKPTRSTKSEGSGQEFLNEEYKDSWFWEQKGMYVLHKKGSLTAKQIIEVLKNEYEPNLDYDKALNSLPATLSVSHRDGKLSRIKADNGEFIYSMPNKE